MKILFRITLFALLAVSASPLTLAQSTKSNDKSTSVTLSSYEQARKIIEAGVEALGGVDAIRASDDVKVVVKGYSYARNQSVAVNPPYDKMTRDEELYIDLNNRRYIITTKDPAPGGFVFGGTQVITGNQGFFADPRNRTVGPLILTNFNNIGIVRRLPHLLLMLIYQQAPATVRWLGKESLNGAPHDMVTFASGNGIQWTLYFDAKTHLLSKTDQMVSDNVAGDAVQETIFPGYRVVDGIKVPTGRVTRRAGEITEEVNYDSITFKVHPPESAFAKPAGYEELPAPAPAAPRETKLAENVYLFESGSNSLVVAFKDYVLVVEPYAGGRGAKPTINKVKEMFPNKPLRYVVVTHHHDDHSGGLRSYIAEGVTVVTTPANQSYFEKMAASTFSINRDDQTKAQRKPTFEFVQNRKRVFTDGEQTIEIIDIGPSPHANEMLVAYLPKEKIVFQGDLVNLPANGKYQPTTINDTTIHFFEAIQKLGLDVERITAVHGPTTTLEELRAAIKQRTASPATSANW